MKPPAEAVRELIGPMLDNPSPIVRAAALTPFLAELRDWTTYAADERARALIQMKDEDGMTWEAIARAAQLENYQAAQNIVRDYRKRQATAES